MRRKFFLVRGTCHSDQGRICTVAKHVTPSTAKLPGCGSTWLKLTEGRTSCLMPAPTVTWSSSSKWTWPHICWKNMVLSGVMSQSEKLTGRLMLTSSPLHFFRNYKIFENTFEIDTFFEIAFKISQNFRKFSKKCHFRKYFRKFCNFEKSAMVNEVNISINTWSVT